MSEDGWRAARIAARVVAGPMGSMGVNILRDPKGWDPVVPADLHSSRLPPVAEDGTCECIQCKARHPFTAMTIVHEMYFCPACEGLNARRQAEAAAIGVDVDNVKIGRNWTGTIVGAAVGLAALGVCVAISLS